MKKYYVWCNVCSWASGRIITADNEQKAIQTYKQHPCKHSLQEIKCIDGVNVKLDL